jgi:hypothetical protein
MENNIELELRAEVSLSQFEKLLADLNKRNNLLSHNKRLSVMFLGPVGQSKFDIRVRIDSNGKSELVVKKGDYHAHDRMETSQEISKNQFIGTVKIFSMFGLQSKITERENFLFNMGNDITMVLVKAGFIAYVEIEKMSYEKNMDANKADLLSIIDGFKLKLINNGEEFNELCDRLTKFSDWVFDGSTESISKLEGILKSY